MNRLLTVFSITTCLVLMLVTDLCFAISDCIYSGVNFSDGSVSCQAGHQFRCSDGTWLDLNVTCTAAPPAPTVINPADCSCTPEELSACNLLGQACCVSVELGKCSKKCCPK